MRRVVFDTSSLVGVVLHALSVPHRAWLIAQESCEILACHETFSEIETVLYRVKLSRYIDTVTRDQFLSNYRASVEWVEISQSQLTAVDLSCRDPKDNVFLALAHVGGADLIVSSDHDLLVLHPWRGIPILTPSQFVSQFSA
jgi:hypothetical protein